MFQVLPPQPADALLGLINLFRTDTRVGKIDLGVGTYKDETGITPVMKAVKLAEQMLINGQNTKTYFGPEGDERFVLRLMPLAFGPLDTYLGRLAGVQTPGGSGALRLGAELIAAARPGSRVWLSTPTWPNHLPICQAAGLPGAEHPYFDPVRQSLDFEGMLAALSAADPGDVVLLQGCCHNPTGVEFTAEQWDRVARLLADRALVPFIDLAYQGFGQGLDQDAYGTRRVLASVREALVAYSCNKNFGLYRERTGALFVLASDGDMAEVVRGNMLRLARVNWSMPPDHGAAVVRIVLQSPELTELWRAELDSMCGRIGAVRRALAAADPRLSFIEGQRGMFSQLAITGAAVASLRAEHGIYMAASGRINVAGLQVGEAPAFAKALHEVGGLPA